MAKNDGNESGNLNFEVGFTKSVLGDEYYVGSHVVKSVAELNSLVSGFGFTDVTDKYNENFFTTKSVIVFSFHISGDKQREIESIKKDGTELTIVYTVSSHAGGTAMCSDIKFIEVEKNSIASVTSIKGELL